MLTIFIGDMIIMWEMSQAVHCVDQLHCTNNAGDVRTTFGIDLETKIVLQASLDKITFLQQQD